MQMHGVIAACRLFCYLWNVWSTGLDVLRLAVTWVMNSTYSGLLVKIASVHLELVLSPMSLALVGDYVYIYLICFLL